jgi:hypothetical protein
MVRTAERSLGRNCKAHAKPTLFATPEHLNGEVSWGRRRRDESDTTRPRTVTFLFLLLPRA